MSAELQTAVANEALELSQMFRQNAALKHGLPDCRQAERITDIGDNPPPAPPVVNITNQIPAAPAATNSPSPGLGAAQAQGSSLLSRAAPFLLTTAGLLGGGGIGLGINSLMHKPATTAEQPAAKDGDLLQWLQTQGRHLPEGWSK